MSRSQILKNIRRNKVSDRLPLPLWSSGLKIDDLVATFKTQLVKSQVAVETITDRDVWQSTVRNPLVGTAYYEARAAVAETGSVLVKSGEGERFSSFLLTDHLEILVLRSCLLADLESAMIWIAKQPEARVFSLFTGPSRTADIELTLALGAHGAKSMRVWLLDDGDGPQT